VTSVPSLMFVVRPASTPSVAYASGMGDSGGRPAIRIWKKWSITHRLSTPASSACRAMPVIFAPSWLTGTSQEKLASAIPSFIDYAPCSLAG